MTSPLTRPDGHRASQKALASRRRVFAEVDRDAPLFVVEHGDELETGTEGFEVLAQRRDADVFAANLAEILQAVASALKDGLAVTVAPVDTTLTTQQAADMLGVSRPTLVKLPESGKIPFTKPGRNRRVRLDDLLRYREELRQRRSKSLDELSAYSQEIGLDDEGLLGRQLRR